MNTSFLYCALIAFAVWPSLAVASTVGTLNDTFFADGTTPCPESAAACSGTAAIPGTTSQLTYSSYGVASYGSLGGYAQASVTPGIVTGSPPAYANVAGGGYFVDTFTFNGTDLCGIVPCAASGVGTIRMQFIVNGMEIQTGPSGDSVGGVCMVVNPGENLNFCDNLQSGVAFNPQLGYNVSPALAIAFGQPTTFSIGFFSFEHILNYTDPGVSFTANFADTVTLAGFIVDDANGNPLQSFSVSAESGAAYPNIALPEPSTVWTSGMGILLFLAISTRLRRSAAQAKEKETV